jgi:hypothetical protein
VAVPSGIIRDREVPEMNRLYAAVLGVIVVVVCGMSAPQAVQQRAAGAGWTVLFDGKNLDRWTPVGNANWKLADGVVEANMGTGFLVSKASYGDFELKADIWTDPDANSGIFIRCSNPMEITAMNAYEVNIFDKRPDPAYRTGAIVNVAKPKVMFDAANKWVTMEIIAKGPRMTVTLNGMQTVDAEDRMHPRGPIALQYGAGTVKFRNIQIR